MTQYIGALALLVPDYDSAIDYYTQVLGFSLKEDTPMGPDKRWVVVSPPGAQECDIILAKAKNASEQASIGNQAGGRGFLFLHTDDFWRDYDRYRSQGVRFLEEPREEPYATVAVFQDALGNRWDLLEKKQVLP